MAASAPYWPQQRADHAKVRLALGLGEHAAAAEKRDEVQDAVAYGEHTPAMQPRLARESA